MISVGLWTALAGCVVGSQRPEPSSAVEEAMPAEIETTALDEGVSREIGGVSFTLAGAGHKHAVDGGAVGMYAFRIGEASIEVTGEWLYIEGTAGNLAYAIRDRGGRVIVESRPSPGAPWTEDEARDMGIDYLGKHGLQVGGTATTAEHGTVRVTSMGDDGSNGEVIVGRHTHSIVAFRIGGAASPSERVGHDSG